MTEQKPQKQAVLRVAGPPGVNPDRAILLLVERLRNGEWGRYPYSYTAWADRDKAVYERAQTLLIGHEVLVAWTETPAKTGKGVYRDIISLERPPAADRPSSAALPSREGLPVPGEAPQAAQEAPKGPPEQPARTPLPPKPLEAPQRAVLGALEYLEYRDRAIMAQVALKEASQTVREWLAGAGPFGKGHDLSPEGLKQALELLRKFTLAGYEAEMEAIRGGEA